MQDRGQIQETREQEAAEGKEERETDDKMEETTMAFEAVGKI